MVAIRLLTCGRDAEVGEEETVQGMVVKNM